MRFTTASRIILLTAASSLCFHSSLTAVDAFHLAPSSSSSLSSRTTTISPSCRTTHFTSSSKACSSSTSLQSSATATTQQQQQDEPKQLQLYNSLTRTKTPITPIASPQISMYTCGPTVYDSAHVGNFRAFLTYDILKRTLLYLGYNVDHICNLTDVDDKIINKCNAESISLQELTDKYTNAFFDDLEALNIIKARAYPRATEHIDEMAKLILDLEQNGLAYQSDEGSWYFSVSKKEGYGTNLVQLDPDQLKKGASSTTGGGGAQRAAAAGSGMALDADEYDAEKEGVRDFCLWKAYKPEFDREDAIWDPVVEVVVKIANTNDDDGEEVVQTRHIGKGRPGWHLECSAMARKYLGPTIDLHAGGIDLKFPHHENEIAQSEGANCAPFCNCWVHNGFVNIGDEKMSKSKGNFLTLRKACPTSEDVRAYRYLVVSSQYRNPLSFTEAALGAAKGALKRLDRIQVMIDDVLKNNEDSSSSSDTTTSAIVATVEKELANFEVAIADDLSMPRASACLFSIVKAAEKEFKRVAKLKKEEDSEETPSLDMVGLVRVQEALKQMDQVFGIYYEVPQVKGEEGAAGIDDDNVNGGAIPEDVMDLVVQRTAAKDAKDWELADSLRAKITELGFAVKDVKGGDPIVSKV
mmetsp:Transcript_9482/g.19052  ORF Transcript_9482/g.19052 Transcript_9482/m.19052 type:complete len:639 (+) Transcript_9482:69-1985(+)